jgi:long-chain acyl-CoA synthetase
MRNKNVNENEKKSSFDNKGTLAGYLRRNYLIWGDNICMRQKDFGIWHEYTWKQCYQICKYFAEGLLSLGFRKGDKVCIMGDNELEAYLAAYGVYGLGGIIMGIWVDALPEEVVYYLNDSQARYMIVRDQEQIDKVLTIREKIPLIEKVIWWEPKGMSNPLYKNDNWIVGFEEVVEMGRKWDKSHPNSFEERIEQVKPEDPSNIYYTSGTTGDAKGVVRTHAAQVSMRKIMNLYFPLSPSDNCTSMVQFAAIGEPMIGSAPNLIEGAVINFPESPDTLEKDMREIGPAFQILTPRFYEEIAAKMRIRIEAAGFLKRSVFNMALRVGYKIVEYETLGKKPPIFWRFLRWLSWWLAFRPNLDKSGLLKLRYSLNSSFILGQHTFKYFRAVGLDLRELYASTEVPFIATQKPGDQLKIGTLGTIVYGTEVRLSDESEFLIRGQHRFNEYYNKPEKTEKAIDPNGWYHSGDAGYIDNDGYLYFIDRVSELTQLATGHRYSPQAIEAQMRFGAYIKDCWLLGENKEFTSAIITIDFDSTCRWAEKNHIPFTTMVDLSQKDEVAKLVLKDILRVNATLPPAVRIKKFAVLHKLFDPDEAELTRTRKLRREYMYNKYGDLAEAIYQGKENISVEAIFSYADGTKATVSANVKVRNVPQS